MKLLTWVWMYGANVYVYCVFLRSEILLFYALDLKLQGQPKLYLALVLVKNFQQLFLCLHKLLVTSAGCLILLLSFLLSKSSYYFVIPRGLQLAHKLCFEASLKLWYFKLFALESIWDVRQIHTTISFHQNILFCMIKTQSHEVFYSFDICHFTLSSDRVDVGRNYLVFFHWASVKRGAYIQGLFLLYWRLLSGNVNGSYFSFFDLSWLLKSAFFSVSFFWIVHFAIDYEWFFLWLLADLIC